MLVHLTFGLAGQTAVTFLDSSDILELLLVVLTHISKGSSAIVKVSFELFFDFKIVLGNTRPLNTWSLSERALRLITQTLAVALDRSPGPGTCSHTQRCSS